MTDRQPTRGKTGPAEDRTARLKAALKSNMGRRKAQARARAEAGEAETDSAGDGAEEQD